MRAAPERGRNQSPADHGGRLQLASPALALELATPTCGFLITTTAKMRASVSPFTCERPGVFGHTVVHALSKRYSLAYELGKAHPGVRSELRSSLAFIYPIDGYGGVSVSQSNVEPFSVLDPALMSGAVLSAKLVDQPVGVFTEKFDVIPAQACLHVRCRSSSFRTCCGLQRRCLLSNAQRRRSGALAAELSGFGSEEPVGDRGASRATSGCSAASGRSRRNRPAQGGRIRTCDKARSTARS
jgi:hypothetical protein